MRDCVPTPASRGSYRDQVATRKEADESYARQLRLFDGVASSTPDFVYVFDLEGRFQYANHRLLEVWGMRLEDVVGKTCRDLGYEQWHHDMHMREIAQVMATKRAIKGEVPFKAPLTGIFGVYEYIFTPVIAPDGAVEAIAGTTRDVTERKRGEDQRRRSEEQGQGAGRRRRIQCAAAMNGVKEARLAFGRDDEVARPRRRSARETRWRSRTPTTGKPLPFDCSHGRRHAHAI